MAFYDPEVPAAKTAPFPAAPVPHPAVNPAEPSPTPKLPAPNGGASNPWLTDPGYLAAITQQQQQGGAIDSMTKSAIARLLVQYGDSGIAGKYDPGAAGEAAANTQAGNSIVARLLHQHGLNQRGIINSLAAHGILFSGDAGYRTSEENRAYGNQVNDAQQSLLSAIDQANTSSAQQKQGLAQQVISALENAYNNYVQNPAFYGQALAGGSQGSQTSQHPAAAPSPAWLQALHARSAALNSRYGL